MKKADRTSYRKHSTEVIKRKIAAQKREPEKTRARKTRWNRANPAKLRAYNARPERQAGNRESKRRCYEENPETVLERNRQWRRNNPEAAALSDRAKRGNRKAARGHATPKQISDRIALYRGLCAYCGSKPYEHIDHVIPLSCGGTNWPANLRPACADCNLKKGEQTWCLVTFDALAKPWGFSYKNRELKFFEYASAAEDFGRMYELVLQRSNATTIRERTAYCVTVFRRFLEESSFTDRFMPKKNAKPKTLGQVKPPSVLGVALRTSLCISYMHPTTAIEAY
jgi:5-methylcytosine-specific restriction endonuclease McrA